MRIRLFAVFGLNLAKILHKSVIFSQTVLPRYSRNFDGTYLTRITRAACILSIIGIDPGENPNKSFYLLVQNYSLLILAIAIVTNALA